MNNFRGELTDISAIKEGLYTAPELVSLYLNNTHKIWTLCSLYIAQRHA